MNKFIALMIAGAMCTFTVNAADFAVTGDVGLTSQNMYRGEVLGKDVSFNGRVRADNLLIDGLFVEASGSTINTTPLNQSDARTEINLGWHGQWDALGLEVSLARVFNTRLDYQASNDYRLYNTFNYNEARALVTYDLSEEFRLYGVVGQGFKNPTFDAYDYRSLVSGSNTYLGVGAESKLTDRVTIGTLYSVQRYDAMSVNRYNNTEVYATVNLWKGLEAEGRYSFGGYNVLNNSVEDAGYVGVKYRF